MARGLQSLPSRLTSYLFVFFNLMAAAILYFGPMCAPSICPCGTRASASNNVFRSFFSTYCAVSVQLCTQMVQFVMCTITGLPTMYWSNTPSPFNPYVVFLFISCSLYLFTVLALFSETFVLVSYFFPLLLYFFCLGAVLRNTAHPSTKAETETTVRNWLRLSRDRDGGQQRRGRASHSHGMSYFSYKNN